MATNNVYDTQSPLLLEVEDTAVSTDNGKTAFFLSLSASDNQNVPHPTKTTIIQQQYIETSSI